MGTIKTKETGFTLLEVLIAMAILFVGALTIVPLFVFASETAQVNARRTIAVNLANAKIEEIRSFDFTDVSLDSESPPGKVKAKEYVDIDNVLYEISISITAPEDDTLSNGEIPLEDLKLVQVKVTADAPNRSQAIQEEMHTLIARTALQEFSSDNGIRIYALRGWQEELGLEIPVKDVKVTVTGPNGSQASRWLSTTNAGVALFPVGENQTGTYQVDAEAPTPMIILPGSVPFEVTVPVHGWAQERVYVEYPSFINITLRDWVSGAIVNESGTLRLRSQLNPVGEIKSFSSVPISEDVLGPLWPLGSGYPGAYSLLIQDVKDFHDSDWEGYGERIVLGDGTPWDGTFEGPNVQLALTVHMIPIPQTPDDSEVVEAIELEWLNGNSHVINHLTDGARDPETGLLMPVKFISGNPQTMHKLPNGTADYTAAAMYWERGIYMDDAHLTLNAGLFKFSGPVELVSKHNKQGLLTLQVPQEDGYGIDGGFIHGGLPGVKYGEVHFIDGIFNGDPPIAEYLVRKGAFYFPHGIILPQEANSLIPWYKLD